MATQLKLPPEAAAELGVTRPSDEMMEHTNAIIRIGEEFKEGDSKGERK